MVVDIPRVGMGCPDTMSLQGVYPSLKNVRVVSEAVNELMRSWPVRLLHRDVSGR